MSPNANLNELIGQYILVHPELQYDPASKQNWPGMIWSVDIERDDFVISFHDNTRGLYSADTLLILKPVDEIYQLLADHGHMLAAPDLKTLTQINLFLQYGIGDKEWKALELAASNPNIQELSLDLLKDRLALQQSPSLKR